jgi:hypothetical protein
MLPVSYMSPCSQAWKCSNFVIVNWLFVILAPPLPRPPGYLGGSRASCPDSSSAGRSAGYLVGNPESYPDGNPASYPERSW